MRATASTSVIVRSVSCRGRRLMSYGTDQVDMFRQTANYVIASCAAPRPPTYRFRATR
jgi:hypothetical protein